jgi:dolichyl-phosphate-mannose-protein mannosyltransferase
MKLSKITIPVWLLLLACLMTSVIHVDAAAPVNLIQNGGFEQLNDQNQAVEWGIDFWNPGSGLGITDQKAYAGKYSGCLKSVQKNDIRLVQNVAVEPNTVYRLTAWVATENIPIGTSGANVSVLQGFVNSGGLTGTNDWRLLELNFRTHEAQHEATIAVRLGAYGDTSAGTVFFDEVRLEKIGPSAVAGYIQVDRAADAPLLGKFNLERPQLNPPALAEIAPASKAPGPDGFLTIYAVFGLILMTAGLIIKKQDWLRWRSRMPEKRTAAWDFVCLATAVLLAFGIRWPLFKEGLVPEVPGWTIIPFPWTDFPASALKLLGFGSDVAIAVVIFAALRQKKHSELGLALATVYLLLPAVLMQAAFWGPVQSIYSLLLLGAYLFVRKGNIHLCALAYALACGLRLETILLSPVLLIYWFRKYHFRSILAFSAGATVVLAVLMAVLSHGNVAACFQQLGNRPGAEFHGSESAANLLALLGGYGIPETQGNFLGLNYFWYGALLIVCFASLSCYYFWKSPNRYRLLVAMLMVSFSLFLFAPRMQAASLLPVLVLSLLTCGYYRDKKLYLLTMILALSCFFNLQAVGLKLRNELADPAFSRIIYILAIVNLSSFLSMLAIFQARAGRETLAWKRFFIACHRGLQQGLARPIAEKPFALTGRDWTIVAVIAAAYCVLIFFRLGSWSTPQTGLLMNGPDRGVEIQFEKPSDIRTVAIYDAEESGRLIIEQYTGNAWNQVATIPTEDFYVMKRVAAAVDGAERLRLVPQGTAGMINEVAFLGADNQLLPVKTVITPDGRSIAAARHPLFDEQRVMLRKPSYLNSTYFDEIYHGRTAYEFIKKYPVYETTHPPFGKDLLSLGILMFGMNPFGMRFIHALMGVLLMIALFFLGREILASRFGAYAVMAVAALDFMPYVQSRYSTIDTTSVLCITLMFLFTFRWLRGQQHLGIGGERSSQATMAWLFLFFALAVATKWTGAYAFSGAFFCFVVAEFRQYLAYRRERSVILRGAAAAKNLKNKAAKPKPGPRERLSAQNLDALQRAFWKKNFASAIIGGLVLFILIVPGIYCLTYIPFLNCVGVGDIGSGFRQIIESQKGMYDYHSKLAATHPFSSSWWGWPFNFKPLWIYSGSSPAPGMKDSIVSMGNPLIWFLGLVGVVVLLYKLLTERRFSIMHYVFIGLLSVYLPWVLVSRIAFIYHFYPVLPLYYVVVAFLLESVWRTGPKGKKLVFTLLGLALVLFVMFYPVLSGIEVPSAYVDKYLHWFPKDWVF